MPIVEKLDTDVLSHEIYDVFQLAYRSEAELLGVEDFPPLMRRADDIRFSETDFYGVLSGGHLLAAIEIDWATQSSGSPIANNANIDSLAVKPSSARQGLGSSLLQYIFKAFPDTVFSVSTATANVPAIALYEVFGFVVQQRVTTKDGFNMSVLSSC